MPSDYDPTEFIDGDFQVHKSPSSSSSVRPSSPAHRAPTSEEVDSRVVHMQQRLVELKRAQEELEREKNSLEEMRRRQMEFQTGRQEMIQNLTRGTALLEEAEFNARREVEQMAKTVAAFKEALGKVQDIQDQGWTKENLNVELTRALTLVENARMEWNSARLKLPVLDGVLAQSPAPSGEKGPSLPSIASFGFGELCRLGFALTWPVGLAVLATAAVLILVLLRR